MSLQDKEQYLSTTKELIKQGINNLGEDLTNQSTFRSYKAGLDNVYDDMPKVTVEGTELTINNTRKGKMELTLKGNTSQESTSIDDGDEYDSPSPDHPQPIRVVTGNNTISIANANVYNNLYLNGFISGTGQFSTSSQGQKVIYAKVKPNTKYYIYKSLTTRFIIGCSTAVLTNNAQTTNVFRDDTATYTEYTTSANAEYINIYCYATNESITFEQLQASIIISESPVINYLLNLGSLELCKIENAQDFIFKNTSDSEYYDDSLVENGWYKYGAIGKAILNGTENWVKSGEDTNVLIVKISLAHKQDINFNTHFPVNISGYFEKIDTSKATDIYLGINKSRLQSSDVNGLKTWLDNNNVTLYYILKTPTSIQITDETLIAQLEAINNAMSAEGNTSITQTNADLPFIISASALKAYPSGTINITENGNNIDVSLYNNANVNVQPNLQSKDITITENGTTTIEPDTGYDGLSDIDITVDVPSSGVPDWSQIGYSDVPQALLNDFAYSKDIYDNWNPSITWMRDMYKGNKQIVFMPNVDTSNVTDTLQCFSTSSLKYIPELNFERLINATSMFSSAYVSEVTLNFPLATTLSNLCYNCTSLRYTNIKTPNGNAFNQMFAYCSNLITAIGYDLTNATNVQNMFQNCHSLSNDSLNYLLLQCSKATSYTGTKTLRQIGLSQTQAETCQTLSNYQAFLDAGWTTGY